VPRVGDYVEVPVPPIVSAAHPLNIIEESMRVCAVNWINARAVHIILEKL